MNPPSPPTKPPTAAELLADPGVQAALDQAWVDSQPGEPAGVRHEEGGWIYMDLTTGVLAAERAPRGAGDSIDLHIPTTIPGSVVVGKFHTHPNPTVEGWVTGPSPADLVVDAAHGVPDLIRAEDGVHVSGPDSRRGGLAGGPGFPP
jgi:hypothetical protein